LRHRNNRAGRFGAMLAHPLLPEAAMFDQPASLDRLDSTRFVARSLVNGHGSTIYV